MKREDLDAFIADVLAEHLEKFKLDIQRMVSAIALPPFLPPPMWAEGRHSAGSVVRHRNGLFSARRDTADEPPTEAWLPVLVGIASVDIKWPDDRRMVLQVELSDGNTIETEREFNVPIARGFWNAEQKYRIGDRVLRFGEWQAIKDHVGIDPHPGDNSEYWVRVAGKQARGVSFRLDNDGKMYESEHVIGDIRPVVHDVLAALVPR